jgi:hypothetical protein
VNGTRLRTIAIAFMMVAVFVQSPARGQTVHGFVLQIGASQNATQTGNTVWKVGTPVVVIVTMINNSKRTVHYSLTSPGRDYEMDVRDASGNPVPESEQLRQFKQNTKNGQSVTGRNILGTLKPHETAQDTIEVSSFYDLSRPGEYSIQVQRQFPEVGKGYVKSNRLKLSVTP